MSYLERFWAALYVSETWYGPWRNKEPYAGVHYKARGIVLFDRVLNGELVSAEDIE